MQAIELDMFSPRWDMQKAIDKPRHQTKKIIQNLKKKLDAKKVL